MSESLLVPEVMPYRPGKKLFWFVIIKSYLDVDHIQLRLLASSVARGCSNLVAGSYSIKRVDTEMRTKSLEIGA